MAAMTKAPLKSWPATPGALAPLSSQRNVRRQRVGLGCGLLLAAVALDAGPAVAQTTAPGTTAPSLLIPLEPPEALPDSGTAGGYFFNLRSVGADFGRSLADRGVYLVERNLIEPLGNVSGGVRQGGFFEGLTLAGVDLDMARIAGI